MEVCADGCSYGDVAVKNDLVNMSSFDGRSILDFRLESISQCVVPQNNRDEVEIHFHEDDKIGRDEDAMVQVTFHFPFEETEDDEVEEETKAEEFKKAVIDSGVMKAATGNVIVEFTKDQGNFVTPKGKYSIQVNLIIYKVYVIDDCISYNNSHVVNTDACVSDAYAGCSVLI